MQKLLLQRGLPPIHTMKLHCHSAHRETFWAHIHFPCDGGDFSFLAAPHSYSHIQHKYGGIFWNDPIMKEIKLFYYMVKLSPEVNPSILIGSYLDKTLQYGLFPK